jgi:predicted nuclease of predicted toxin-antitoxin system
LSLRLLVDECLLNKLLLDALTAAGHDVQTVRQTNLLSKPDDAVFAHAIAENRIVITSNCDDFTELSNAHIAAKEHHPGVLLVFQYNNPNKDMSVADIIKAIANFEATGAPIQNTHISLARYKY